MKNEPIRLRILNDFAFRKSFGEKGCEFQLAAFLNAVLQRTGGQKIASLEIVGNKELPPEILGGKLSKLDVRAVLEDGTKINIEVQLKNEYNMGRRSLRYWAVEYEQGITEGQDYIELPAVIAINILDFSYIGLDEFHTSFHIYEDQHKEYMLTDALEIHFIETTKWRKLKDKDMEDPLHRWMVYFDEQSPAELVEEVVKMDMAIQATEAQMAMIMRDPALKHAYDMFEKTRIDYKMGMQGARLEGMQEGRQEGRQEGILEGRQEGILEGRQEGILEGRQEGILEGRQEGRQEGILEGILKGEEKGRLQIARNLKKLGVPLEQIVLGTGLSAEEIAKL
ncbi:MAG: Rpn family recombination-promoting nuclease/putative transposase [Spirochaetaceae bacterium]|jgi:predicted transposase/invertase (TIGR01784 family)|nr:Rpn family recombination-promoting nuclease/putative transposase [Spirochaetaceae bacterium]